MVEADPDWNDNNDSENADWGDDLGDDWGEAQLEFEQPELTHKVSSS